VEHDTPEEPRFVLIVAPHTSNWDFPLGVLAMFAIRLRLNWLGKHSIFRFPVAGILRWLGGEPIERSASHGTVEAAIEHFQARKQWVLGIAPEGTRRRVEEWKSGFYRIAVGAGVPIVPVRFDYGRRVVEILDPVWPAGDVAAGIAALRRLFRADMARHPAAFAEEPPETGRAMEPGSPPG
jgi:1-acyl-sn-glycerol-3-phosphate acyltransferase